jgi:hypothetical protein
MDRFYFGVPLQAQFHLNVHGMPLSSAGSVITAALKNEHRWRMTLLTMFY